MGFRIEETIRVGAPLHRVWEYIIDPHRVVRCLPGAELTGDEGERTYLGRVKVKVGPVTASYAGRAQLAEVDETRHSVLLTGEGRESGGAGSARLTMRSRLITTSDGATEIRVDADVDVAGKIVQFGRGMIEGVSRQLFRQFAECVRAELETSPAPVEASPHSADPSASPPAPLPHVKPIRALPLVLKWLWSALIGLIRHLTPRPPAR